MTWHAVIAAGAIGEDEVVGVKVAGLDIAVVRSDGAFFALGNICTHQNALLSDGVVEDGCLECPLHQGRFDLKTGAARGLPAEQPVPVYNVRVEGGQVMIEIE